MTAGPTERRHVRAAFLAEHRWALAFGMAIAATFALVPRRPPDASLAWDLIPALALVAAWLLAGVGLGALARRWARADLPLARAVER